MRRISETLQHAIYNGSITDAHNNQVDSWANPEAVGVYAFDPGGSSEPQQEGQDRVVTAPMVFMPSSVVFSSRDRITARGLLYEVDGETAVWRHPNGRRRGNACKLKRVTG